MSSELLSCPICYNRYNHSECVPRMIPKCGHTVCSHCLTTLIQDGDQAKCPFDKGLFSSQQTSLEAFPLNYTVYHLLDESSKWKICEEHHEEMRLVCMTDRCKVCHDCAYEGAHKGHEAKSIKRIKKDLEASTKELQSSITNLDKHYEEVTEALEDQRKSFLLLLKTRFQDLRFFIQQKELDLWYKVNAFFDKEKNATECCIGSGSSLRAGLLQKIKDRENISQKEDIFSILEEDNSVFLSHSEATKLAQLTKEFKENTRENLGAFENSLSQLVASVSQLDFSPKESLQDMYKDRLSLQIDGDLSKEMNNSFCQVFNTSLEVKTSRDNLFIEISLKAPQNTSLRCREWKEVKNVKLDIEKESLGEEDMKALCYVFNGLEELCSVQICFDFDKFSNPSLLNLFSVLFVKPKVFKAVEINFENIKADDDTVISLSRNVFPKMKNLTSLHLNLSGSRIGDKSMAAFARHMASVIEVLEDFSLRLDKTDVTSEGIEKLFIKMPKAKAYRLDVDRTQITGSCLERFADQILPSMKALESFEMWLSKTEITDRSVIQLLKNMPNVKTLIVGLGNTDISDVSVDVFINEVLPRMNALEDLRLYLDQTKVTASTRSKIVEAQEIINDELLSKWIVALGSNNRQIK